MIELAKAGYLFAFSLGCWTSLNLLLSRRGERRVRMSMMVFIVLLLLPPLSTYLTLALGKPVLWLLGLSRQLTWAYGPLMVIHVRQVLLKENRTPILALHALPFVLFGALGMSAWGIGQAATFGLLFLQLSGYLGYAAWLLLHDRRRLRLLSREHAHTSYFWLLYCIAALLLATLVDITIYIGIYRGTFPSALFTSAVASMLAVFVSAIALFVLYRPDAFFHEAPAQEPQDTAAKPAVRVIELSPAIVSELDQQLRALVQSHKPHLDVDISLGKLASLLGVTSHQLSELLNIHMSTSFYDFLNDLRYQESLAVLADQHSELTIADIAYRSGFNNRNSFYKVFKDKSGLTPSQYKKSVRCTVMVGQSAPDRAGRG